jgi:hypothetical protein
MPSEALGRALVNGNRATRIGSTVCSMLDMQRGKIGRRALEGR